MSKTFIEKNYFGETKNQSCFHTRCIEQHQTRQQQQQQQQQQVLAARDKITSRHIDPFELINNCKPLSVIVYLKIIIGIKVCEYIVLDINQYIEILAFTLTLTLEIKVTTMSSSDTHDIHTYINTHVYMSPICLQSVTTCSGRSLISS